VSIKAVKLHPIEEDFYNALYTQTSSSFSDYVADGTLLNNYAHIFDLLMRMRQSVSHPYLVVYSNNDRAANLGRRSQLVANGTTDCVLCHNPPSDRVTSTCCQAAFCRSCVLDYMATSAGLGGEGGTPCPNCSNPFSIDLNQVQETVDDEDDLNVISSIGLPSLKELSHVATSKFIIFSLK
jgi:DNA repair protein RAD16